MERGVDDGISCLGLYWTEWKGEEAVFIAGT